MKSLEALKHEANQSRCYRTSSNQRAYILWHVSDLASRIPGVDWSACCQFPHGYSQKVPYEMELKHMIHWGKADARIIEDAFGVELPSCVHDFYSEIKECVLNWKESYQILSPQDVVDWEKLNRETSDEEDLPIRLIRFCKVVASSDSISLRKNTKNDHWNIQYNSLDYRTKVFQSAEFDTELILADNLDEWLLKLMANDGILDPDEPQYLPLERIA